MNNSYEQLADLVKEKAFEQARDIYKTYGREASRIYSSYRSVVADIAFKLEDSIGVPSEVIESTIEAEGWTAKLGEVALFSHVRTKVKMPDKMKKVRV